MRGRPGRMPLTSARSEAKRLAVGALTALLLIASGLGGRGDSQRPAGSPDVVPPTQEEPPVQTEADDPRGREQRVLRQVIYRDRQAETTLSRAERAFHSGDAVRAVECVQQVFDQQGDHFVWSARQRRLVSARHQARELLATGDAKIRELYERANLAEAARLLERGQAQGDAALVGEVARRFFHTPSGFEATDWLASRWLDRGEYALASHAWASLATDPQHRLRMGKSTCQKAHVADQLGSRRADESQLTRDPKAEVRTADLGVLDGTANDDVDLASSAVTQVTAKPDSDNLRILASRAQSPASYLPYMKPAWRFALAGEQAAALEDAVHAWESQQQRDDKRAIAVHSAVAAGTAIIFRTYEGICAVEAASGRTLWNYTTATSFNRAAAVSDAAHSNSSESDSTRVHAIETMWSAYAGNSNLGTLTTDGLRVLAVDSVEIRPRQWSSDDPPDAHFAPERFARGANRLIALDVSAPRVDSQGKVKPAWSVGGTARTSNWFYRMDGNDDGRVSRSEFQGTPEEFRTLDRNGDGTIDRSEAENPAIPLGQQPLEGHFFLGPPLALDGRLYAVTECDCRLNLVALNADKGTVLWVQGIGYVDRPIDEDSTRAALACTPCFAGGIIVCPTQVGIVVGVDALDGALLWTYHCGDEDVSGPDGWMSASHRSIGNPGFRHALLVEGNRLVLLPRQSETIHCVDLISGVGIWKKPRRDAEYIAAAADGVVMIAGERLCRGLSLEDGSDRWTARVGELSGCGVRVGTQYLLPLADNRIAALDVRTGGCSGAFSPSGGGWELSEEFVEDETGSRLQSWDLAEKEESARRAEVRALSHPGIDSAPGNLVAAGANFVSVGPREVVAFPRAEVLLDEVKQRLLAGSDSCDDQLLAAELELSLGRVAESKWQLSRIRSGRLTARLRAHAEHLARSVLYQELADHPDEAPMILGELEKLSQTRFQRARLLQARAVAEVRRGNPDAALDASRAFAQLGVRESMPSPVDSTHLLSAQSWLASVDDGMRRRFDDAALSSVESRVDAQQRLILQSNDRGALERFLAVNGRWPAADVVRVRVADLAAHSGDLQQAELLLIQNLHSGRPDTKRTAAIELARLWDRAGLADEAASLLADVDWPAGAPLEQLGENSLARIAYRRIRETERPFGRARIRQSMWERCDGELAKTLADSPRAFIMRPASTFQLIDGNSSSHSKISVVDRLSGRIAGTVQVPANYTGSPVALLSQVGHFLPLGSRAALHGISLLHRDRKAPLWTTSPRTIADDGDSPFVGPCGPTFCVFQSHRHLIVVDPGTGALLWQRTDLDPKSGLSGDPIRGIFGDEEVLVVLGEDHLGYTVYRTATGEELRQGRLPNDAHQSQDRRTFGRRLVYFTAEGNNRRIRIWDALTNRVLYDRPIPERQLFKEMGDDEIAVITADGALEIVDPRSGEVRAKIDLGASEVANMSQLAAFADSSTYYVNLQPVQGIAEKGRYYFWFGTDLFLPRVDVRGDMLAIDRHSGKIRWRRSFPQRSVVRVPSLHLPVLVMLSMVGDHLNGNHTAMLVEAVDTKTGQSLGLEDNQFRNRILRMTYEHERGRVRLWGDRSVIDLDFDKASRRSPDEFAARPASPREVVPR